MNEHRLAAVFALFAIAGAIAFWEIEPKMQNATGQTSPAPAALTSSAEAALPQQAETATSTAATAQPQTKGAKKPAVPVQQNTATAKKVSPEPAKNDAAPSTSPQLSFDTVNTITRAALVNIVCEQRSGSFRPISGTGVIIDPRGIILTNAHVAQYVLLAESPNVNLSCYIRTGAPAKSQWVASVLYIPPVWVAAHAAEVNAEHATGTGEHDYALLYITGTAPGGSIPSSFPYLPLADSAGIPSSGNQVLVASYPAEFVGGVATQYGLYPGSSITSIGKLLTFASSTVDAISLGGIIEAQSGSSGGAVTDAWGKLVGLIATMSGGTTTGTRDLRAVTTDYINRDITAQTGLTLSQFLAKDPAGATAAFTSNVAPSLLKQYLPYLGQ